MSRRLFVDNHKFLVLGSAECSYSSHPSTLACLVYTRRSLLPVRIPLYLLFTECRVTHSSTLIHSLSAVAPNAHPHLSALSCVAFLLKVNLFRCHRFESLCTHILTKRRVTRSPSLTHSLPWAALNARSLASIDARYVFVLLNKNLLSSCPFESLCTINRNLKTPFWGVFKLSMWVQRDSNPRPSA